jgi:hypothetical protein
LRRHPALEVASAGASVAANIALERVHAGNHQFVLHFDVDVISADEFPWTNFPGTGGLSFEEVRAALRIFAGQPNLVAIEVAGYNPELDPDGAGAQKLVDLIVDVLSTRLETAPSVSQTVDDRSQKAAEPAPSNTQLPGDESSSDASEVPPDPPSPDSISQ